MTGPFRPEASTKAGRDEVQSLEPASPQTRWSCRARPVPPALRLCLPRSTGGLRVVAGAHATRRARRSPPARRSINALVVGALPSRWTDVALRIGLRLSNGHRAHWRTCCPMVPDLPRGRTSAGCTWLQPGDASRRGGRRAGLGLLRSHRRRPRDSVPLPWRLLGVGEREGLGCVGEVP